jgi:GNAT superfamily N-acetyltransferase
VTVDAADCVISLEDASRPDDIATVHRGLEAYNLGYAPPDGYRPLNIFLRTSGQKVVGGLLGCTYWGWLYISIFWLQEDRRRQGYGKQILAAAEQEAVRRGCQHVHLDTLSFQALPFYERQGYTRWGVLEDLPPGHRRFFLKKDLGSPVNPPAAP